MRGAVILSAAKDLHEMCTNSIPNLSPYPDTMTMIPGCFCNTILNLNVDKSCEWIFRCAKAKTRRFAGGKSRGFNAGTAEKTPQDCLYLG